MQAPARVVIESVRPQVDGGRYPIKRVIGEEVRSTSTCSRMDTMPCRANSLSNSRQDRTGKALPMDFRYNDHWVASFRVEKLGRYQYTVRGWTDPFLTWRRDLKKRRKRSRT